MKRPAILHNTRQREGLKAAIPLLLFAFFVSSCSEVKPPTPDRGIRPIINVKDGTGLLFTYFSHKGQLLTVDRIAAVEQQSRGEVEVVDPKTRLSGGRTFVADLRKQLDTGKYRVWIEPRGAWLQRNMPKVTVLKKPIKVAAAPKKKIAKKKRKKRRRKRKPPAATVAAAKPEQPAVRPTPPKPTTKVVVFSTSWCPSCKQAVAYFRSRGIAFLELDVEKDPQAAQQYMAVCQRSGLKQGAVPVIIVNGQVFQGFSRLQIDGALARAGLGT